MEENDRNLSGLFTIKVKVGSTEIEVSAPEKDFVLAESSRLIDQLNLTSFSVPIAEQPVSSNGENHAPIPNSKASKPQTLAEFFKQFAGLQTNLDKMLVIGYWCEVKLDQQHFSVEDIQTKYKEIREASPANIKRDLGILRSKGFLMPPEKSDEGATYVLSNSGIKEVESKMTQA